MNTQDFLELVWPSGGIKVLALVGTDTNGEKATWQRRYDTAAKAARAAAAEDAKGTTVYFAVNGFGDWYVNKKGKRALRTQENVVACRSLFDDFDVDPGKDGTYDTIEEAAAELALLHKTLRLTPTIVASGGGLHSYITLEEDIDAEEWDELARMKRAVVRHLGIRTDPKVGTDSARVLRPVGTRNHKFDPPRQVKLKKQGKVYPVEEVRARLEDYIKQHALEVAPSGSESEAQNPFAAALGDYPPTDAEKIATHCAAVRQLRDTGGDIPEPHWWAAIGVVKHCERGEDIAHEWSKGYDGYSPEETQAKIDEWDKPPTTCQQMDEITGCMANCPFAGKIKSPISLGFTEDAPSSEEKAPEAAGAVGEVEADDSSVAATTTRNTAQQSNVQVIAGQPIPYWPSKGWRWNGIMLSRAFTDDDNVVHWRPFCRSLVYPVNRIKDEDGNWNIHWRALEKNGGWREFFMPTSELASTDMMAKTLAGQEVFLTRTKNARTDMAEFTEGLIETLQEWRIETKTYKQFGWSDDYSAFVLGTKKITLKGEEEVLCDPAMPPDVQVDFGESGTLEEWVDNIDTLFNRPGAEPFQFALCHSMGSALVEMFNSSNWHGLPLALTGHGSTGKSTACKIACGFYGNPKIMERQTGDQGSTLNAAIKRLGVLGSIPMLFDEFSGRTPDELTRAGYAMANGRDKERLSSNGSFATTGAEWYKNSFITSNDSLHEGISKLPAGFRVEATQLRFFEVHMQKGFLAQTFPDISSSFIENHMDNVYGTPARKYLRFLIKNQKWVRRQIVAARDKMNPKSEADGKERFYRDTIVTAVVAGKIASKLGLVSFDINAMRKWAMAQVVNMRESRQENNTSTGEHVARFIASLQGRLIITRAKGDSRKGDIQHPFEQLRAEAAGRVCTDDRYAVITARSVTDYAKGANIPASEIVDEMERSGLLKIAPDGDQTCVASISAGTQVPGIRCRCYELHYDKLFSETPLRLVQTTDGTKLETRGKEG